MNHKAASVRKGQPFKDLALQESLSFNTTRVGIINSDPTSKLFVTWFHISCYFPVLTACLGPISNTISIACVVEKWRETKDYKDGVVIGTSPVEDPVGIFTFNVISLVLGFASNIVLLLHFSEKLSYLKAQCICIVGWTAASIMLLIDVIVCATKYIEEGQEKTIGFWYAVITSGLYFGCTITLTTHFVGYFCGRYPARFNLIKNERSLMVFTVFLSVILIWGGGMFSGLLHVTFGTGLYFCVVTILTIGLGDVLPYSVGAKIMVLIYSTTGVVTLALIIAMTRGIFQESAGSVVFFHRVEVLRVLELQRIKNGEVTYTQEESFKKIQKIRKMANTKQRLYSLLSTLCMFVVFWNFGSLALMFAENWSYFNGIYFSFMCLMTIGYGDYAPASGAGRAFFVLWALGAIPLMSAILSTVGDLLLDLAETIDLSIARKFKMRLQSIVVYGNKSWDKFLLNNNEILPEEDPGNVGDDENDQDEDPESEQHTSAMQQEGSKVDTSNSSLVTDVIAPSNIDEFLSENTQNLPMAIMGNIQAKIASKYHKPMGEITFKNTKLDEMQRLLDAFKKFRSIAKKNKKYCLTFEQWNDLSSLYIFSHESKILEDPAFWLSEFSPLRFPLDQPRFVVMRLLVRIEELITNLLEDEEIYDLLAAKKGMPSSSSVATNLRTNFERPQSSSVPTRMARSMSI